MVRCYFKKKILELRMQIYLRIAEKTKKEREVEWDVDEKKNFAYFKIIFFHSGFILD